MVKALFSSTVLRYAHVEATYFHICLKNLVSKLNLVDQPKINGHVPNLGELGLKVGPSRLGPQG